MTFLQILPSPETIIALFCYELSLAPKQSSTTPSSNSQWGTQLNLPPPLSFCMLHVLIHHVIYICHMSQVLHGWVDLSVCIHTHTFSHLSLFIL